MYTRKNVDYGLNKPDEIIFTYCQVYVNYDLHIETVPPEKEEHWIATTVVQYTLEEWNAKQIEYYQVKNDLSITNAYETSLTVKEES